MALPLVLSRSGGAEKIETRTKDVSSNSFYFVSDRPFSPDDRLECELIIPGDQVTSVPEDDLCVRCEARVVRVESQWPQMGFGVACQLEDYTISRSARELTPSEIF
jgi:hypothetical protein